GSGDAGQRDAVDEAAGLARHEFQALVGARRGDKENQIAVVLLAGSEEVVALFSGKVRHDKAINARLDSLFGGLLVAELIERIRVPHEHERNGYTVLAQPADEREAIGQRDAFVERDLARALNGSAVGEWVAEGHTDFHEISSGLHERHRDLLTRLQVWVAHG